MFRRMLMLLIVCAGLLPALPLDAQTPDTVSYIARGPFAVGVRDLVIDDGQGEALSVSVWYPAQSPEGQPDAMTYEWDRLRVAGHALRDAPPADGVRFPLVIFSHGLGGFRFQSVFLTEHLASYGFVVMAADHPGSTLGSVGEDMLPGNMVPSYANRPLDVLRQIGFAERLTAPDGLLSGVIDTDRVAVSGHSFGGYTALAAGGARLDFDSFQSWCVHPEQVEVDIQAEPPFTVRAAPPRLTLETCFLQYLSVPIARERGLSETPDGLWPPTTDSRIKAVVAMAPWNAPIFGPEGLAALTAPAMILIGSADRTTHPQRDAYAAYYYLGSSDKMLVVLEGANHMAFVNKDTVRRSGSWGVQEANDMTNHFVTAFLRYVLYGDEHAASALTPEAARFDRITYLRAQTAGR